MSNSNNSFFTHLPPPAECLAIIVGALELIPFGIAGLRSPNSFADSYGLPISDIRNSTSASSDCSSIDIIATSALPGESSFEKDQEIKGALVAAIAARNVQNGMLLLAFGLVLKDRKSLGVAVLAGLVTTVADTLIVRAYGVKKKITGHCFGIFNSLMIGGSLLYWGRNDSLW
ncbi:hypothetical protein BKA66DRAFT_463941 [Pyrenochaeta sp. MPI-SDFR-AT-0127]|nr:hypothetical protein BKA66DRAFT_463941 [Pyrenochaeta sp. MPI-SDFR-AT-0127]